MKKVFALVLAIAMVLTMFAGCGAKTDAPAANDNPQAEAGKTPESGASATPIKVGSSGPLNNDYAVYGKAVEYGLTLAFEEINALGGLQFELRVEDDEADSEMATNAYNTLMDWGMQIMAGPTTSGSAIAAADACAADTEHFRGSQTHPTDTHGNTDARKDHGACRRKAACRSA